ncbi:MAG: ABC transporter permease [Gammaproteobacteria bacterium]|nr:ABC transporter permease [Gammaproteobacteria bacterium]
MLDLHGYFPFILKGMGLTVSVAVLSLFISLVLGFIGALAKLSDSRIANAIASVYTTIIRGVPDLVLMMLIFFGGQLLVNDVGYRLSEFSEAQGLPINLGWDYIDISPFIAGVITIGFIFGAYMTETFRGAILAVPRGEIEAGYAFGMSPAKVFFRITLPACVRHALPGFGNNWLVLAKTTALVSVIGLPDMVFNANQAGGATRQPFTFFMVVALLFLVITGVSDIGLRWLNKRYSAGVRRA